MASATTPPIPIRPCLFPCAVLALALCLSGCILRKTHAAAAAPAPPQPSVPAAAAPPQPLSVPQTQVHLPAPQPLSPEALASTQPPQEPPVAETAPPIPTHTPAPHPRPAGPAVPRTEPAASAAPATPPAPETERPPIQEALPAGELKRLQEEAIVTRREVRRLTEPLPGRLNSQQEAVLERVRSFLQQSEAAESRGEMRQASELAARALVLARELKP